MCGGDSAMLLQGFASQCVLVLLLTVYIMSTFSVDEDANKDLGVSPVPSSSCFVEYLKSI